MKFRSSSFLWLLCCYCCCCSFTSHAFSLAQQQRVASPKTVDIAFRMEPLRLSSLYYQDGDDLEQEYTTSTHTPPRRTLRPREQEHQEHQHHNAIAMPLIRAIWYNQAAILLVATAVTALVGLSRGENPFETLSTLHWTTSTDMNHADMAWRLLQGMGAAVPMIGLGTWVEQALDENRDACQVNFSTTHMVLTLFGRRTSQDQQKTASSPSTTSTPEMMGLSAMIALSTGISEELVFRLFVPAALLALTHSSWIAWVGQAILFAAGHLSLRSSPGENRFVGSLQFVNALWYGMVYMATGGDILPCILAHVLYDCHVLSESWHTINTQMDYTEFKMTTTTNDEQVDLDRLQVSPDTLEFARRFFYAFDSQHQGSLSKADVHRAVAYAFLQEPAAPSVQAVDQELERVLQDRQVTRDQYVDADRLTVSDFLKLLFSLKAQSWAQNEDEATQTQK